MVSLEEYINATDDSGDIHMLDRNSNDTIGKLMAKGLLPKFPDSSIFYCRTKDMYMHCESILGSNILLSREALVNIDVLDSVEVKVKLFNNIDTNRTVIINNGSATFGDIKEDCEWVLLLNKNMPIIGWKVDGKDVGASEKVFDHIISSSMSIEAVIKALENCGQ